MRLAATAVLCLLLLSACGKKEAPAAQPAKPAPPAAAPAPGFAHEAGFDPQGYYLTETPIEAGGLRLTHIAMGAPSDFEAWEGGKRQEVFGPILVQFEDPASPMVNSELGEHHAIAARVLPTSYSVSPGRVVFHGHDARLGEVSFDASFDTAALAQARADGAGDKRTVLKAHIQIGDKRFEAVAFSYWAGD